MNTSDRTSCLLVSTVTTDESISMRLYARNLELLLRQRGYRITSLHSGNIKRPILFSKLTEVLLRYIYYPLCILRDSSSVVHITDHAYAFLIPIVRLSGKKCIVSVHNRLEDILSDEMWERHAGRAVIPTVSRLLFRLSMRALPSADRVICISPSIYNSMVRMGVPTYKLSTIPPPVSDIFFKKLSTDELTYVRRKIEGKKGNFFILHPGNNDPAHKNIEHILRCVAALRKKHIRAQFIKAGEGFTKNQQDLIAFLGINDSVTHLGTLSQRKLRIAYHYSDVLLFPSYYEGCPAPPWEALASGLPIIVSDIPAHRDCFARYAIFTSPDDYKKSAAFIERLRNHPNFFKKQTAEGKRAALRMRRGTIANKLYTLYADITS